jgi:molybdopterin-guanine dinucleotide biosynthesis protein A
VYSNITGIILSGGKNSRMGTNKALLKIGDRTVIEIIVDVLSSLFSDIIISTNSGEELSFLQLPTVADLYQDAGPLAGIHAALTHSRTDANLIISCDLPLMSREMVDYIVNLPSDKSIVICRAAGFMQPLPGRYHKRALTAIEEILAAPPQHGYRSFLNVFAKIDTEIIEAEQLAFYRDELFFNMNEYADYKKLGQQPDG